MLLHFPRPDEPNSVRLVSSESVAQGSGIEIVGVTVELTEEPVTTDGLGLIAWAYELGNKRLDGSTESVSNRPLANTLYQTHFVR
jgi:hypothetical protein